jgi:hypothetical protein
MKMDVGDRLHRQHVEADDGAGDAAALLAGQLAAHVLAPAAGGAAEVDNDLARLDQFFASSISFSL